MTTKAIELMKQAIEELEGGRKNDQELREAARALCNTVVPEALGRVVCDSRATSEQRITALEALFDIAYGRRTAQSK